ncbi:MAG: hypothetical protein QY330_00775 [Candidatus Dojkabacteria bacterium]|nr:MAG: hypothetical protein QY330_00775 [Candidatus Dojkabacteria bacterium]
MNQTMPESEINLALTGWPGVGTSTLTLLLAHILQKQYIYIGSVFRAINNHLKETSSVGLTPEFEATIQPMIGRTMDNYVDHVLLNEKGIILESDLAAFRIGKNPKVYSIFIKANLEARKDREKADGRVGVETSIEDRDASLKREYIKLWDTNIFDEELIAKKYNLIIDNSNLSVAEEVYAILERYCSLPQNKGILNYDSLVLRAKNILKKYHKKTKAKIKEDLDKAGLSYTETEIMTDIAKTFPEDIQSFPKEVQNLFLGLTDRIA